MRPCLYRHSVANITHRSLGIKHKALAMSVKDNRRLAWVSEASITYDPRPCDISETGRRDDRAPGVEWFRLRQGRTQMADRTYLRYYTCEGFHTKRSRRQWVLNTELCVTPTQYWHSLLPVFPLHSSSVQFSLVESNRERGGCVVEGNFLCFSQSVVYISNGLINKCVTFYRFGSM